MLDTLDKCYLVELSHGAGRSQDTTKTKSSQCRMSGSAELLSQIDTARGKRCSRKSDLSKCFGGSWTLVFQNLGFGRVEMRFVQTLCGIRKMVAQNLSFRRVEATMCCGQYHFLTIAGAKKRPRNVIVFCAFHDMNLKIR